MVTRKFRKSKSRKSKSRKSTQRLKTVRRHRISTAGKILPPLDVRSNKHLSEFEKRIKKGALTIILVWAPWCPHCHTLMPHFDAAAKSSNRSIQAVKVEDKMLPAVNNIINRNINGAAKPLNVEGYPSIIIVDKKGNEVANIEPVRDTDTMTKLMAQAGPLAESAGINNINENSKNSIKNNALYENSDNITPLNVMNANNVANTNAMILPVNNKNKKLLANLGIQNQGLVSGTPRNADIGEDELLGSIASKNNKNKNIKLKSFAKSDSNNPNKKNIKENLKEATAPSPLNTFEPVKNTASQPTIDKVDEKVVKTITSLRAPIAPLNAPLLPPSIGSDIEELEPESISNKLTAEQKVSGGGYNRKDGGSLYSAMARTTYLLAPTAGLLATAAMVMKGNKRGTRSKRKTSKHSKKNRKTHNRRR